MFWILLTIILILSLAIIVMVLLQPSKGGGITAAFGGIGGTIGSTFGQRRTLEALGQWTTYAAIAIATLCIMANIFFIPQAQVTGGPTNPVTEGQVPQTINEVPQGATGLNLDNQSAPAADAPAPSGDAPAPAGDAAPADGGE